MPESSPEVTAETINNKHHSVIDVSSATRWFEVCAVADLDENDVTSFKHDGQIYAIFRLSEDNFYASEGLCTHGKTELGGGLVINGCIECPKHNGRFDVTTGKAVKAPAITDLKTFPAQRRGNKVFINIPEQIKVNTPEQVIEGE
jgi:3-phenylpropionate/trans-cinnamate dioxygenase ferredoxin subunit